MQGRGECAPDFVPIYPPALIPGSHAQMTCDPLKPSLPSRSTGGPEASQGGPRLSLPVVTPKIHKTYMDIGFVKNISYHDEWIFILHSI